MAKKKGSAAGSKDKRGASKRRAWGGTVWQRADRGGAWYWRALDPNTGQRVSRFGGLDRETAERALAEFTGKKAADVDRGVRSVTVAEFWEEVRAATQARLSEFQFSKVESQVKRCAAAFKGVPMYRIGKPELEGYFLALRNEGVREAPVDGGKPGTGRVRPLSPATLTRHKAALGKLWGSAVERNAARENPVRRIGFGRVQEKEPTFLTVEQVAKLYQHLPASIAPFVTLLAETGARFSEVAGLQWHQVAHDLSTVTFARTKSGKVRTVPTTERARAVLRELRAVRVVPMTGADVVLSGLPLSHSHVLRVFRDALKSAGLPEAVRLHDLRHSYASQLVQNGVPLSVVAQLLGHSSMIVTNRYARHAPASLAFQAVQALELARGQGRAAPSPARAASA